MEEITLSRIVALIKKLEEEEHPEANNMLRITFYDDVSGSFNYDGYPDAEEHYSKDLVAFFPDSDCTLVDLLKKYGV